jgi:hypothetical protein
VRTPARAESKVGTGLAAATLIAASMFAAPCLSMSSSAGLLGQTDRKHSPVESQIFRFFRQIHLTSRTRSFRAVHIAAASCWRAGASNQAIAGSHFFTVERVKVPS